jgi:predicted glycogen debranching enzyme
MNAVDLGPGCCNDLAAAERREWLVTNGLGGFASGTVAGMQTRRYHGLLIAALKPPVGRTFLVAGTDETVVYDGNRYELGTSRWRDGTLAPSGYRFIERFRLEASVPVWTYAFADARLEKRVWMEQGANATFVEYRLLRATAAARLEVKMFANYRDFHAVTQANGWQMHIEPRADGVRVDAFEGATPVILRSDMPSIASEHAWYRGYELAQERSRGLDDVEDHLHAVTFAGEIVAGSPATCAASAGDGDEPPIAGALERRRAHERRILAAFAATGKPAANAPASVAQLALAADQFVVRRAVHGDPEGRSLIAGYHWFGDWGRDAMIALPGLTLATGRPEIARKILGSFAPFVDRGMLPNYFPDAGEEPQYNTVDAALWYVEAVRQYVAATGDRELLRSLFPVLQSIVEHYRSGTRYGIHEDGDGLLAAGEAGTQVTWMDAKVGDWVVTPRIGKPVEISALWYNALRSMAGFARELGESLAGYDASAARTRASFERFWNEARGFCFDVLDGPSGNEDLIRPSAILAVSLHHPTLSGERARALVDACGRKLLAGLGLRSLAEGEPGFQAFYAGSPRERDGAYHQGTVWGWLLGHWLLAHLRVYGEPALVRPVLEAACRQIDALGMGTLYEVADAEAPFTARGAIAQAWTVGEMLRAWQALVGTSARGG